MSPLATRGYSSAHPRVCGENTTSMVKQPRGTGSSPRVRGKRPIRSANHSSHRLIPACAGKTTPTASASFSNGAHPRVCGENLYPVADCHGVSGSSPRVRGKQAGETHPLKSCGLIPACAGKTALPRGSPRRQWAHPRVCGENARLRCVFACQEGSSPRVRGKLIETLRVQHVSGLIPACAGKT